MGQAEEWTQTAFQADKGTSEEVQRCKVSLQKGDRSMHICECERRGDVLVGFTIRVRCLGPIGGHPC